MSDIYLKVTIEKNWRSQNFDILGLNISHQVSFWGAPTHADIIEFSNFLLQLKNERSGNKTVWRFYYFIFERNVWRFEVKSLCILLNKNINFNKNETESNIENLTDIFRETNLVLQVI